MENIVSPTTPKLSLSIALADQKYLYIHSELERKFHELDTWKQHAWESFSIKVSDSKFPCLFSMRAWKNKSIRIIFCDKNEKLGYFDFLYGLIQYTNYINSTDLNKRLFSPLVVFFSPEFNHNLTQHKVGWEAIKWVHSKDVSLWPSSIPKDPESPDWTFCFNNVELFVNMSTKDHKILLNRNLGPHLTLVINARENFDTVANGQSKSGRLAREKIRERVKEYNDGVLPKELGFYGEKENLEWEQYQLSEEGLERPSQCPFSAVNKQNKEKEVGNE